MAYKEKTQRDIHSLRAMILFKKMGNQPKISIAEAILLLMYIGATDLIGMILFLFGLDDFGIIDLLTFPVTQFYLRIKGVRANFDLIMGIMEVIPYLGALPFRTIGIAVVVWQDRRSNSEPIKSVTLIDADVS